ncbi:TetR/AcrR family transcriptional regulator [Streptomyces sp. NPDC058045]|uniref:TetR/AcrR family transcriptional regulator n=1 Tax=Streptomyces sp. NPDC058045 TaxID=3346311 RepID=UPI0036E7C021
MGHREDLLEGAKRCLLDKGFVGSTARDIVRESGTNLASIGYHYGSKSALLAQAYISLMEGLGDAFGQVAPGDDGGEDGSLERFEAVWAKVVDTFEEARPIWRLSVEVVLQGDRLPGVREQLAEASYEGRRGMIPLFQGGAEPEPGEPSTRTLGGFYQTLLNGLMFQWLFDPASATTAPQLTEGLRQIMTGAGAPPPKKRS